MSVHLRLKNGEREIEITGTMDEIGTILGKYWSSIPAPSGHPESPIGAAKKTKGARSSSRKTDSDTEANAGQINGVVQKIKSHAKIALITEKILHKKDRWNKIGLVLIHADDGLTSGEVQKCLHDLGVKIDQPSVSHTLKKSSSKVFNDTRRTSGAIVRYKLTGPAKEEIAKLIKELTDG